MTIDPEHLPGIVEELVKRIELAPCLKCKGIGQILHQRGVGEPGRPYWAPCPLCRGSGLRIVAKPTEEKS